MVMNHDKTERGWTRTFEKILPLRQYDIILSDGRLVRGVYGNEIISMKCGIAPGIEMHKFSNSDLGR